MSQAADPPPGFDPRLKHSAGIAVLERGLPALPDVLAYTMSIPVAAWEATRCAVVLFLEFSRDSDGTVNPIVVMGTFTRDGDLWSADRHWLGVGWSHDPIASPRGLRDLGGRAMVGGGGSFTDRPASGHPAVVVTGRVRPAVKQISLIQDGREDRRSLRSHFGAWVVCTEQWSPYQINALGKDGSVLASLAGPPHLPDNHASGSG